MQRVTLTFVVDVDEGKAWDIAEGLEKAAMARNYREVNSWVEAGSRGQLLGTEESPVASSAETIERKTTATGPMGFGGPDGGEMITLGDENGRMG